MFNMNKNPIMNNIVQDIKSSSSIEMYDKNEN